MYDKHYIIYLPTVSRSYRNIRNTENFYIFSNQRTEKIFEIDFQWPSSSMKNDMFSCIWHRYFKSQTKQFEFTKFKTLLILWHFLEYLFVEKFLYPQIIIVSYSISKLPAYTIHTPTYTDTSSGLFPHLTTL